MNNLTEAQARKLLDTVKMGEDAWNSGCHTYAGGVLDMLSALGFNYEGAEDTAHAFALARTELHEIKSRRVNQRLRRKLRDIRALALAS